jgi:arylsulfatase A-like enzyme/Flp pilus assembly protein TadD
MGRRKRNRRGEDTTAASPSPPPSRHRHVPAAVAALVVVIALAGAGLLALWRARPPRSDEDARARLARMSPKGPFNVVLVTLDTTRADRLGCYGFSGVETPNLDALCRDAVVFDNATAVVPLTFPSHSSIFTGLVPPHHGVRDNGGFFLDEGRTTLAERMRDAGYATGAFIGAWVLESRWGLAQGFQHYDDHFQLSKYKIVSLGTVQKPGDEVMDEALPWLDGAKSGRYFAWVHLYDPHAPYEPPEPFASRYARNPYLGEIAYTDKVFGRLMGWLRDQGQLDRTIVVVTGDHGESLGDHGEASHSYFIYGSTTHVPFIVRTPWGLTGRRATRVSGVDLMPTVLDLVGLPPQPGIDGRSLARLLFDPEARLDRPAYSETYFPRYHYGWQQLQAMRDDRYTYIDAPEPELYDLQEDPGETRNVFKSFSARAEPLRLALVALAKTAGTQAPERQSLDPETLQHLAALGYVGNVIDVDPTTVLPDPKAKLPLFQMMNVAKDLAQKDRVEDAVERLRRVVAADPKIMDAHLTLGNWLVRLKRPDEAAASFKQALALKPDDDIALGNLARLYLSRGRKEDALEALEVFRAALRANPKNPQSWYQLAGLYLDTGRLGEAESAFRDALAANPRMGAACNGLGVIAFTRGDLAGAEQLVRKGLALEPTVRTAHYNLGRILEARGDAAAAEALYREELATYPDHGRARFNLAQLLRARGDRDGYLAQLREGVDKAPDFGACYWYLAREELGAGRLEEAADLARRGLLAQPVSEVAPLGHYVLADVYTRQGQPAKAEEEVGKARRLEAALRKNPAPRI